MSKIFGPPKGVICDRLYTKYHMHLWIGCRKKKNDVRYIKQVFFKKVVVL